MEVSTGISRIYLDGTLVDEHHGDEFFQKPIYPGGVVHMGQEADDPWGAFDELQSFGGLGEYQILLKRDGVL